MQKERIDLTGLVTIVILTLLWGVNYSVIKVSNSGLSPVFTTFLRSVIATILGVSNRALGGIFLAVGQRPLRRKTFRL